VDAAEPDRKSRKSTVQSLYTVNCSELTNENLECAGKSHHVLTLFDNSSAGKFFLLWGGYD